MTVANAIQQATPPATLPADQLSLYLRVPPSESTHHGLAGRRFVVPNERRPAAAALRFFLGASKTNLLMAADAAAVPLGFPTGYAEGRDLALVRRALGTARHFSTLQCGTPGPYRKDCIAWSTDSEVTAISKIAASPEANPLLQNEHKWLRTAQDLPELRSHAPQVVSQLSVDGRTVLTLTPFHGERAPARLSSSHVALLHALQSCGDRQTGFTGSRMHRTLSTSLAQVKDLVSAEIFRLLEAALRRVECELPPGMLMVSAHRDFAPWNILEDERGLCLLDWEYASEQYLPLYDIFHFFCMPVAVKKPVLPSTVRLVQQEARRLGAHLAHGDLFGTESVQMLAYLLDRTLLHIVSRRGLEASDLVMNAYIQLMRNQQDWRLP